MDKIPARRSYRRGVALRRGRGYQDVEKTCEEQLHLQLVVVDRGHKVVVTARQTNRIKDLGDADAQVVALDVMAPLASRRMTTVPCPRARPGEPSGPLMASSRATSARNAIAVSDCERAIRQKCASTVQLLDGGDVLGLGSLLCGERTRKMANRGLNMDEMADTIAVSIGEDDRCWTKAPFSCVRLLDKVCNKVG
ncbi:hypothetical protein G6O67_007684 [Ophiocordyceps sinensis]|uniref:Uncharacterized protein n=2 Tax=Ophiocordyceps sinensis TaxID=72228 RepID=A0A8H4LUG3_9HYPO|nr:hypothetical protein OCS_03987 [Ophiocordyceps sinensis CO18]KAF4505770.1 hypothetical protein G6O67_007684 [Ophiocordyceps sinensis]